MTIRKRRQPTPYFKLPPPYSPVSGETAALDWTGIFPFVAMMQVAKEDVHKNYVICRGHDIRFNLFYDYEAGNPDKPGIAIAKPYGRRRTCVYRIAQILPAVIPMQSWNPQPATVPWRVGKNPGVATVSSGHPADLLEEVEKLYTDEGKLIDWMFLEDDDEDLMVRALECIKPGDTDKRAQPQKWDGTCWVDDDDKPEVYICDCRRWLLALENDCFEVELIGCDEDAPCYQPTFPYGLTRRVKVKAAIECNACGEVTLLPGTDGCPVETGSDCTIVACNGSNRRIGCDADEYATLHCQPGPCSSGGGSDPAPTCYGWLVANPRPLRAVAKLATKLCGGGAQISGIVYKDVCEWTTRDDATTAANPLNLQACAGRLVELGWNDAECGWEVTQVPDEQLPDWMLDIQCKSGECMIEKKTKLYPYYGHFCECDNQEDEWDDTGMTGQTIDVVKSGESGVGVGDATVVMTGLSCKVNNCGLEYSTSGIVPATLTLKTKKVCVFCQPDELEDGEDITIIGLVTMGAAGAGGSIDGEVIEVLTGIEAGDSPTGIAVVNGATCSGCSIDFTGVTLGYAALKLKKTSICALCPSEAVVEDGVGPAVLSVGEATTIASIAGVEQAVVTGLTVKSEVTSDGGGTEEDCDTAGTGVKLIITAQTKTICVLCPTGGEGTLEDGEDIELTAFKLSKIDFLSDAILACDPCPALTVSSKVAWAFCVGDSEDQWDAGSCECVDCEEESA
jgi:hypothetical protein